MDWLDFLHVVDSSFPTGAYAHSSGLETLAPTDPDMLEQLIALRTRETLARFELVFLLHAYTCSLVDLDELFNAMLLPREAREASSVIGTSLLRSVADVVTDARLEDFAHTGQHHHYPIVFGALAAGLAVEREIAASAFALQHARSLVSAAQRLGRIGQRDA